MAGNRDKLRRGLTTWIGGGAWLALLCSGAGAAVAEQNPARVIATETPVRTVQLAAEYDPEFPQQVKTAARALEDIAIHEHNQPLLVLEIRPGVMPVDAAIELAEFLISSETAHIRTVAWTPESLTGPRALLPLVCKEIVLHLDAELGDLSAGAVLPEAQRQRIQQLAGRHGNPLVSPALVQGMLDGQVKLLRIELGSADKDREVRIITADELALLQQVGIPIKDLKTLKEPGVAAKFTGSQAMTGGFLAARTASTPGELADLYGIAESSLQPARVAAVPQHPVLIRMDGMIEPLQTSYLQRQIDRAVEEGADLVIFEIDSPGGYLRDSLELAFAIVDLRHKGVRTAAYIPREAISGAAIIALGCDEIYLRPNGKIGDAGPILQGTDGAVHRAPEKIVSYLSQQMRELAEVKGRPEAVLIAMVNRELTVYRATHRDSGRIAYLTRGQIEASNGVWAQGPAVPESENELLLTVNGRRAHELRLAEAPVEDFQELQTRLGVPAGAVVPVAVRTWMDDTVFILNQPVVVGLLFFLGLIFLFIELHFMVGIFGILSALCFGVFFWSKFLGGTSGWLEVVMFLLGLICLALEFFVIPGFGVFGVAGGLLILASLVMAGVSYNALERGETMSEAASSLVPLGIALVAVIGTGMVISQFLPHIPVLNAMILAPPNLGAPVMKSGSEGRTGQPSQATGMRGEAVTMLRPSGKVRVEGRLLDAVSTGGFIAAGSGIEVVGTSGGRTVVRSLASEDPQPTPEGSTLQS